MDATVDNLQMFLTAIGFQLHILSGGVYVYTHDRASMCRCGDYPYIVPSTYEPGMWIAQCPTCAARTVTKKDPIKAVRAWNIGDFTPETKPTREKLTKESMSDEGATKLLCALKQDAVDTLLFYEKHNMLDCPEAQMAAWFINNDKVIQDIVNGDRRRREEEKNNDIDSEATDHGQAERTVPEYQRESLGEAGQDHDPGWIDNGDQ